MINILNKSHIRKIHCLGIGGIGVSGLAEILLRRGYQVSGTDPADTFITQRLKKMGAVIWHQHIADNIHDVDAVVYSSAIMAENPEYNAAKKRRLPLVQRGELLAELMRSYQSISVSGTHGKTTTTAMIAHILMSAGKDPTYVLGGILNSNDSPVRLGHSIYMLAEADESDASFLYMQPTWAVITNIEADHLSTYEGDVNQLQNSFLTFANSIKKEGIVVCGMDDAGVQAILPNIKSSVMTFGFLSDADIQAQDYRQRGLHSYFNLHS